MPKYLSGYTTALPGVVNFADPNHPGYGQPYLILNGDQNGGFSWDDNPSGSSHVVTFCIPWENLISFRQYVLVCVQGGTRSLPMTSPYYGAFPGTYATSIAGAGGGLDNNVGPTRLYADLILQVTFSVLPYGTEGAQAFLEITGDESADFITVPNAKLQFAGNSEPIEHDAGVLIGQVAYRVTSHYLPDLTTWIGNLQPLKGKVSSADVTMLGNTYPAGTLLFPTFGFSYTRDSFNNIVTTGNIALIQRDLPWNKGIRSDGTQDTIVVAGTSTSPYPTADLNGVFSA